MYCHNKQPGTANGFLGPHREIARSIAIAIMAKTTCFLFFLLFFPLQFLSIGSISFVLILLLTYRAFVIFLYTGFSPPFIAFLLFFRQVFLPWDGADADGLVSCLGVFAFVSFLFIYIYIISGSFFTCSFVP